MANVSSSNGLEKRPKLRFPGFDEPWKAAHLSDYFAKNIKKNTDGAITNVICNSAKQGLIPQRDYFDKDIANSDNTDGYYIIETNDFVYNPRKSTDAPYGPISSYNYPEAGIVSPLYLCFRAKQEINPLYFEWYFRSSAWHRYIYMSGDSGARHDRVSIKDDIFFAMPINIPSATEQERIALFLNAIEQKIDKQRSLVEALKKYKRGLLNDMFPQEDATVPKLRLAGFTGEWVQHNLGDLMNVTSVKRIHQSDWTNSGVRFLRARDIVAAAKNEKVSEPLFISQEKYNEYSEISGKVKKGDLLVTGVGTIGVPMLINSDEPLYFKDGNIIWFKNENIIDGKFFYYSFVSDGIQKFILESAGTGTVGTYTIDSGRKTPVYLPVQREEQIQIGKYFSQLDALIVLHQRKLDILMQCKNGIVQQLFI